jgi:O-antigen ligase
VSTLILAAVGVLTAAGASAGAILLPPGRARAAAMLAALALFPLLILGDQWNSPQIADLRDEPAQLIGLGLGATAAALALAWAFIRWPIALPLAIVFALPFRVPLEAGGDTANLLIPLYLVIAAGVLSTAFRAWSPSGTHADRSETPSTTTASSATDEAASSASEEGAGVPLRELVSRPRQEPIRPPQRGFRQGDPRSLLPLLLSAVVLLYAIQTLYSPDFSKSLQNVCFFLVPFSLVYALLSDLEWDRRLLKLTLWVIAAEAIAFVIVGSVEYATRSLFWNDQVIRSNEFHTYFRVNSIFWDPNIYGRYLALTIVVATAALLWARERRALALLTALIAVLWLGLVPTFSQSSFAALLGGLAVLAALRWSWRWTLAALGAGAALAVLAVVFAGGISKPSPDRLNVWSGGRTNLVSGGADLFAQRPLWGYGAGSFPRAYRERIATKKAPVSVSHTQPVTVAAEQGLIGLLAYTALLLTALWTMSHGLRGAGRTPLRELVSRPRQEPVRPPQRGFQEGGPTGTPTTAHTIARIAVLAAFAALLVHTMAYAGFFEDPIAWALLAVGAALAAAPVRDPA